jgi:hypothetical protein
MLLCEAADAACVASSGLGRLLMMLLCELPVSALLSALLALVGAGAGRRWRWYFR